MVNIQIPIKKYKCQGKNSPYTHFKYVVVIPVKVIKALDNKERLVIKTNRKVL